MHYFDVAEEDVRARAARVRLLVLDVDGVLTDGVIYMGQEGELLKAFHIQDGKGINMLHEAGVQVAILTARESRAVALRANELGIRHVLQGRKPKWPALAELMQQLGVDADQVGYVGDDLVDIPVLRRVGFAVAVNNAHPAVVRHSHWRTRRAGGAGAVRKVCELVLAASGRLDAILERYAQE